MRLRLENHCAQLHIRYALNNARVASGVVIVDLSGEVHNFGRPVVDHTGFTGTFDFTIEWTPEAGDPFAPQGATAADFQGTTFLEALKDQLGLKSDECLRTSARNCIRTRHFLRNSRR